VLLSLVVPATRTTAPTRIALGWRPIVIGRNRPALILLDDPRVSRVHARIGWRERGSVLEDLQSRNGTYVNGVRAFERELAVADEIRIGQTTLYIVERRVEDACPFEETQRTDLSGAWEDTMSVPGDKLSLLR
jgi:pSer/pThr/pTyr-binding forkhead associated (FHA) protein